MKYCENCGTALEQNQKFCTGCGAPLQGDLPPVPNLSEAPPPKPDNYRDLLKRLIDERKMDYYMSKFDKLSAGGYFSWNWAAFIFGAGWMLYRKMYLPGLILLIAVNLLAVADTTLSLVVSIALGALGNYIYMRHLEKVIEKANGLQGADREAALDKKSGTAKWVIVAYVIYIAVLLVAGGMWGYAYSVYG